MNSATKVGEIFTKAGESFHKMADMTMMLDAKAQDLNTTSVKKQVRFSPVVFFSIFHWSKYTFGRRVYDHQPFSKWLLIYCSRFQAHYLRDVSFEIPSIFLCKHEPWTLS